MPLYDYRCAGKCRKTFEAFAEPDQKRIECPVCGEGYADRVYLHMAALPGRNKGVFPQFDVQLGCTVESSQHRDRIAKERGLVAMGKEEWERSRNNHHSNHPFDQTEVKLTDQEVERAKADWDDVIYDRVPKIEGPQVQPDFGVHEVLNVQTGQAEPAKADTGVS